MTDQQRLPDDWVPRYLRLLGVGREAPGVAALARLTRRHLLTVPFGNITALLRYRAHRGGRLPALDVDALLGLWEQRRGSGVCFEVAESFGRLLGALGYDARVVPGIILTPSLIGSVSVMGNHQALLVTLGEQRYLIDVGNGAPHFDPIPVGQPVEVRHAGLAYRFRPGDEPGSYLQERLLVGEWSPFCRYELRDQAAAEFDAAYRRHHIPRASFVVGILRLVRCTEEAVYALSGTELTCYTAQGKRTEHLAQHADYERVAREVFGLPALPIVEAVTVLAELDTGE
jgi:arylamine N-acetyltransferase